MSAKMLRIPLASKKSWHDKGFRPVETMEEAKLLYSAGLLWYICDSTIPTAFPEGYCWISHSIDHSEFLSGHYAVRVEL